MASLGELFIELGVIGDVKPLEKALNTIKESTKVLDKQIKAEQRLLKYRQDLASVTSEGEKKLIKSTFANEVRKQKLLDEADTVKKNIEIKKELAKNIAGVVKGIAGFVTAVTGAAIAVNKLTNDLVSSNQALLDLTRTTDIAQSTFQKWGGIGKLLGVENAEQQLEGLNQKLFELMLTGEGARGFQLAGINPVGQDAEGVLEQLRTRIQGMNDTTAAYLLQQMGLDPKMLHILRLTRKEFEDLNSAIKQYRLTPEQTKEIQSMNIQLQIASIRLKYLKDRAILALMPVWTQFMASLARVAEGLGNVTKWLVKGEGLGSKFARGILAAASAIGVLRIALWAITAHPIVAAITAIVGALYLLIDDIVGYFQGKNSGVGYIINYFDDLAEAFKKMDFNSFFSGLLTGLKALSTITLPWAGQIIAVANSLEKLNAIKNNTDSVATGGAAHIGYSGTLPNLMPNFITPAMQHNLSYNTSNTSNTDNRQITQQIQIQTSQPAFDIQNQLTLARYAMNSGWV